MKKVDYTPKAKPETYPKFAGKYSKTFKPVKKLNNTTDQLDPRSTKHIPSLVTPGHSTAPKVIPECTLPNLIGVSIVHKSCIQPVFSTEQAQEFASMRR
jgi:hypothetical protein